MTEHSPLPWFADHDERPDGYDWNVHIIQQDAPHMRVCFMTSDGPSQANAAFIVRAVNSHDTLVTALRQIAGRTPDTMPPFRAYGPDQMAAIAREALAALETVGAPKP